MSIPYRSLATGHVSSSPFYSQSPEVADLGLRTGDGAVERCHQRHHHVVDDVLLHRPVREAHALGEPRVRHLLLPRLDADLVESFVQREVNDNLHEAERPENVADGEDPVQVVEVRAILSEPDVERGGEDEDRHLDGQEVSFEQAVEEVDQALPVDAVESIVRCVGEDAALGRGLFILLVDGAIGDIGVRRITTMAG